MAIPEPWITPEYVILFHDLTPDKLNIDKTLPDADKKLSNLVKEWLVECIKLINNYCNHEYTEGYDDPGLRNILLRLTSNMVKLALNRRDSSINNVNDLNLSNINTLIFTDDIKEDLQPYVYSGSKPGGGGYYKLGVCAITGEDNLMRR